MSGEGDGGEKKEVSPAENLRELWLRNSAMESRGQGRKEEK